jgi:hypothetical protein
LSRKEEAAYARALCVERLNPLLKARHVGDDDTAVTRDIESGRLNDAPRFAANLDDLLRLRPCGVNAVDSLSAPVQRVIGATCRLLKIDCVFEQSNQVWRQTAGRAENFNAEGRCRDRDYESQSESDDEDDACR